MNKHLIAQIITTTSRMTHTNLLSFGFIIFQIGSIPAALLFILAMLLNFLLQFAYIDYISNTDSKTISQVIRTLFKSKFLRRCFNIIVIFLPIGSLSTQILTVALSIQNIVLQYSSINFKYQQQVIVVLTSIVFFLPSMFLKSVAAFNLISPFSIVIALFYTMSILYYGSTSQNSIICNEIKADLILFKDISSLEYFFNLCKFFPTIFFAINITVSVPIVHRDVPEPKARNTKICITIATFIIFCELVITGYAAANFGAFTRSSNLITITQGCQSIFTDILSLVFDIIMIIAYPLWAQPNRYCQMEFFNVPIDNYLIFCILGVVLITVTCILAVFVSNIQTIFGLFASFCGWFLYFLIPGMCWIYNGRNINQIRQNVFQENSVETAVETQPEAQNPQNKLKISTIRLLFGIIILLAMAIVSLVSFALNIKSFIS